MAQHPFRFSVNVYGAESREAWVTKAQKVEALGYDCFFVADHLMTFPPITGMMAAAAATTTLRIWSNVFANDFRHPIMLGREAAAVDVFSNGRLVFGLGTGFYGPDYQQSGIPLDPPGVRVGRLEEAIQIIKGMFTTAPFSFTGKHYRIRDFSLEPAPVQQPHPPILVGGGSPRVLALAAREADIVGLNIRTTADGGFDHASISAEATAQKVAWVKQAASARLKDLVFSIYLLDVAVTDDRAGAVQQIVEERSEVGFTHSHVLESPYIVVGSLEEIVADLVQR